MTLSTEELNRYSRHLLMDEFGAEAQLKLKASKVLVIGAGGLGCPCLLYLAAAGVGFIGIADDDVVSLSNLQRQVLFNTEDVGKPKAETAKAHLLKKNPHIQIQTHSRITRDNVLDIIANYDLVIDGSDNFSTRYLLNDACVITGKPYIHGALFKFEGQVSTFNYQNGPTYRCLYPEAPAAGEVPACGVAGVLGVLPGIIGTWQATEAIKVLTGTGEPLNGKLLVLNLLTNSFDILRFKASPVNQRITELGFYDDVCEPESLSIDFDTLNKWLETEDIQLIDVREEYEFERYNIGGINLPFSELADEPALPSDKKTVVVCETGARSLKAVNMLKNKFPHLQIFNLKGGLQATI
ncbi:molybdopterin-synthase adenylyltransferase MoeB [Paradesertivirga mongoliensis]|uniref:Molybdopterin-synthase adenylyltransferase MoeB n=1 Tax=Paradesertivirga mongoliensis TaxID=2100740 RepID=A0ABW4ZS25_9SPHI|nr:HesA/MoeB/ThiF family protein [Pedobacter mongoliensis]